MHSRVTHKVRNLLVKFTPFLYEKDALKRLFHECINYRTELLMAMGALLILAFSRLYLTWLVKKWTEGPLIQADSVAMHGILLSSVLTTIFMVVAILVSRYLIHDVNQKMVQGLRDRAQEKLLYAGVARVRQFQEGDLFSRVFNDAAILSVFVRDICKRVLGEIMVGVGAAGMMLYLDWRLTLLMCAVIPPIALMLSGLSKVIRKWAAKAQRELGLLSAVFGEQLQGITTIKGFQAEKFENTRFSHLNNEYRKKFMQSELWSAILMALVWFMTGMGLLYMVWYGSQQVLSGNISTGGLITFCLCAAQLVEPIRKLSDVHAGMQRVLAAADRLFEILDLKSFDKGGDVTLPAQIKGDIVFDQVFFAYNNNEKVLEGITMSLTAKETLALVSPSGGGKSTISKLMVRFWDPSKGKILLDGTDIRELRLSDLRHAVCVVEQDPFIFRGSLKENICYGSWNAPVAEVNRAMELADLGDLKQDLPDGLESLLDEGGHSLSGGQKQRIAIARAIVRNPAVLILDEATSAIDSDTEGRIFERMGEWLTQRTVIVMAHRLSTISRFGRIVVMDNGRIIGDGPINELMEGCPGFFQLFSEQISPLAVGKRPYEICV